jgi:hypothetical protein
MLDSDASSVPQLNPRLTCIQEEECMVGLPVKIQDKGVD